MAAKEVSFEVFRGSESGRIVKDTTTRLLGPNDVLVRLTHSGLCGTDEHYLHSGCVLGHEGIGVVDQVGSQVHELSPGDRVGFGYVHKVCGQCDSCLNGMEQFCANVQMYGEADLDEGSLGSHVVWAADMLAKIPASIESKHAAPLMCAGATVWTALTMYGLKAGDRVGVYGMGGLGHLAIQFAAKLGCEVVVLSSSESKKDEAFKLGATDFQVTKNLELAQHKKINHLLICGSGNPDFSKLIPLMAADGTIYPLTVSSEATPVHLFDLVMKGVRIQGSVVAARPAIRRMLDFTALHGIKPIVMEWPMNEQGIEEAMEALRTGKMRYRGVLVR